MSDIIHDTSARTTETSAAEGRLKVSVGGRAAKKSKLHSLIQKYKKDGKGGPGMMPPMVPDQMGAESPMLAASEPTSPSLPSMPEMPPMPAMMPNRPRNSVTSNPKTSKGFKKMGILKETVAGRPNTTNAYHPRNVGRKPSF